MSVDMQDRNEIAADLLGCKGKTRDERADQVRQRAKAMQPDERRDLSSQIDGVLDWVAEYEAEEAMNGSP